MLIRCEFGIRRKHGRVIHPATCTNLASGLFRVSYFKGRSRLICLCAACAFDKVPNKVSCVMPSAEAHPDAEPIFYRNVRRVELVKSFSFHRE